MLWAFCCTVGSKVSAHRHRFAVNRLNHAEFVRADLDQRHFLNHALNRQGIANLQVRGVTLTCGGAPGIGQRSRVSSIRAGGKHIVGCVITDSRVVIGAVTAMNWVLRGNLHAFAFDAADAALAFVSLEGAERQRFSRDALALARSLPNAERIVSFFEPLANQASLVGT